MVVVVVVQMIEGNGVSVQARSYGQALDDEELFIIEGTPGAQLRDIRRMRKMPQNAAKSTIRQ